MPPVGPYKTFDACVKAQVDKGETEDSARKICGEIEKRTSKEKRDEKGRLIIAENVKFTVKGTIQG